MWSRPPRHQWSCKRSFRTPCRRPTTCGTPTTATTARSRLSGWSPRRRPERQRRARKSRRCPDEDRDVEAEVRDVLVNVDKVVEAGAGARVPSPRVKIRVQPVTVNPFQTIVVLCTKNIKKGHFIVHDPQIALGEVSNTNLLTKIEIASLKIRIL